MTPLLLSLLVLLLKSLAVLALSGLTLLALRRASAASRHLVCLLTLVALLALPLFSQSPFSLPVSMPTVLPHAPANLTPRPLLPQGEGAELGQEAGADRPDTVGAGSPRPAFPTLSPNPSRLGRGGEERAGVGSWPAAFLALYLLGVLAAAVRPLLGLWGIRQLARRSRPEATPAVLTLAAACAAALELPRAPAVRRGDVPVPMTWGLHRPVVLLPEAADAWPEGRMQAVLLHELAHIRRRDWAAHRLADFACALYWFHPLVWLTARRLRAEGEIACDDLVLSSGVPAPDYARHLLDIARALSPAAAVPAGTVAMARTTQVEGRITMILKPAQNRRALTRRALLLALLPATVAVGIVAALRPIAKAAPAAPFLSALPAQAAPVSALAPNPHSSASITVQLAGVGDSQKLQWWSQTGALLPKPLFDFANSPLSSVASQRGLHGVLFAFRLPPTAQDVTVDYRLSNSLLTSSAGGWVSKSASEAGSMEGQVFSQTNGVRVLKADFPASASQTNIRVGIASGPWRTTATSTPSASGQMSGSSTTQADNTVYIIGEPTETTDGAVCTVSIGHSQDVGFQIVHSPKGVAAPIFRTELIPSNALAQDIRLVALTTQGQEVLPSSIGDSSANSVEQITAKFSLPPSQIKMVKLQTRPFHYVQFKNVALKPSQH